MYYNLYVKLCYSCPTNVDSDRFQYSFRYKVLCSDVHVHDNNQNMYPVQVKTLPTITYRKTYFDWHWNISLRTKLYNTEFSFLSF